MSKKRKKPTDWQKAYGVGWKSAYSDFRYGSTRPISVAPIFKDRERKSLIDGAMDVLRDWRLTPFENEAAVRAGLRSSFCLKGHGWPSADLEASLIVDAGLRRMGAERPSWEAGQREYAVARENCAWCTGEIEIHMRGRFCSAECSKAFIVDRQVNETRRDSAIYRNAIRIVRRDRKDRRQCPCCGKSFMHDGDKDPRQYCSRQCFAQHRKTSAFAKFPSICRLCGKSFMGKQRGAYFCSSACQLTESRLRTGKNIPKRLTPPIFDYVFKLAA